MTLLDQRQQFPFLMEPVGVGGTSDESPIDKYSWHLPGRQKIGVTQCQQQTALRVMMMDAHAWVLLWAGRDSKEALFQITYFSLSTLSYGFQPYFGGK